MNDIPAGGAAPHTGTAGGSPATAPGNSPCSDPARTAESVLVANARPGVAEAIKYLSQCDGATVAPIGYWLEKLREILTEMRQFDGNACAP